MNIIIGGGSGFVGRALVPELLKAGHGVTVVGRDKNKIQNIFSSAVTAITWQELSQCAPDNFDAVINLTGANIAGKRWSEKYKTELLSSRIESTATFVNWCNKSTEQKPHLYNASAIGYYGLQAEKSNQSPDQTEAVIVNDQTDSSFSGHLVREWERAALANESIPVTIMRFGVVLRRGEGMLKQLELPAKFGLGAVIGTGKQPISWIDADDLVRAILYLLAHPQITGVINLTSPEIVTQSVFSNTMGRVLQRPCWLWLPAPLVKILFGEMGEELLLSGQAVRSQRLQELGFQFHYPTLDAALQHEFHK